jgi:hypothetical protein
MNKILSFITVALITLLWQGCEEGGRIDFFDDSPNIPAQITNLKLEPTPGGAILVYDIPDDPVLSYIKAVYEIQPNVFGEAKASIYSDTLELVGYGDTLSHTVNVYSVGKNNKESEPIEATFQPLSPPVKSVFESINLTNAFGGVNVSFKNESQAKLAIYLMADSTGTGEWTPVTTFYTGAPEGNFSARGFSSKEIDFSVYVLDRWENKSDTLIKTLTPMFEEFIHKDTWSEFVLPNDVPASRPLRRLWNGITNDLMDIYCTTHNDPIPQWFTFDLGVSATLSRMKMHHRGGKSTVPYNHAVPKKFEIWGTNTIPPSDGSWEGWSLLATFESFKPSGQPLGVNTPEDVQYAAVDGEDFEFGIGLPPVRYIRFKTTERYGAGPGQVVLAELTFWGEISN